MIGIFDSYYENSTIWYSKIVTVFKITLKDDKNTIEISIKCTCWIVVYESGVIIQESDYFYNNLWGNIHYL